MITICDADLNDEVVQEYEEISGHDFYCVDYTHRKLAGRKCTFRTHEPTQFEAMRGDMLQNNAISYIAQSVKSCKRAFEHAKNTIPHKKTGFYNRKML